MPDITMCKDGECARRKTCYRFTAKPGQYQSWFVKSPRKGAHCELHMPISSQEERITMSRYGRVYGSKIPMYVGAFLMPDEQAYEVVLSCGNCFHKWRERFKKGEKARKGGGYTFHTVVHDDSGEVAECPKCGRSDDIHKVYP